MAGIGFELRKLLSKDSFTGLFQAYAYAGIISSGPWILSIIGLTVIVRTALIPLFVKQINSSRNMHLSAISCDFKCEFAIVPTRLYDSQ